ncbi:hypothetical protein Pint_28443 [Pistacia integerrima]|uniref:Uncharacterized protein n=1 Tax=Pistacia integerrima TaxID=434235 RepID=A0ACC0YPI1_9ROSI|nr:hypothetical protein Pint_28443 [Pistacia integerrima]
MRQWRGRVGSADSSERELIEFIYDCADSEVVGSCASIQDWSGGLQYEGLGYTMRQSCTALAKAMTMGIHQCLPQICSVLRCQSRYCKECNAPRPLVLFSFLVSKYKGLVYQLCLGCRLSVFVG